MLRGELRAGAAECRTFVVVCLHSHPILGKDLLGIITSVCVPRGERRAQPRGIGKQHTGSKSRSSECSTPPRSAPSDMQLFLSVVLGDCRRHGGWHAAVSYRRWWVARKARSGSALIAVGLKSRLWRVAVCFLAARSAAVIRRRAAAAEGCGGCAHASAGRARQRQRKGEHRKRRLPANLAASPLHLLFVLVAGFVSIESPGEPHLPPRRPTFGRARCGWSWRRPRATPHAPP